MSPEIFSDTATLMHIIQGSILFIFGIFEIYAIFKPGSKIPVIGAVLTFILGLAGLYMMVKNIGNGSVDKMYEAFKENGDLSLYIGQNLLFCAAGMLGVMQYISKKIGVFWKMFLCFIYLIIAVVYRFYAVSFPLDIKHYAMQFHTVVCCALLLGVLFTAVNVFVKKRLLGYIGAFCIFICAVLLVQYKETPKAYATSDNVYSMVAN